METGIMSERTIRQNKRGTTRPLHQRLWWMEFTRGLIACVFGLLCLAARSFAPHLFMYSLGTFLVVDGVLELVDMYRRKSSSRLTSLDWAWIAIGPIAGPLM